MRTIHTTRTRRTAVLLGLAVAGTALVTACSSAAQPSAASSTTLHAGTGQSLAGMPGARSATPGDAMPGMTMTTTTGPAPAPVSGDAVTIKNFAFAPAALVVKAGTTVTWTNQDTDDHTVTSKGGGGPLDSSPLGTGQTFSYTFTRPGTYSYFCTIHPFMTAIVTVTQ